MKVLSDPCEFACRVFPTSELSDDFVEGVPEAVTLRWQGNFRRRPVAPRSAAWPLMSLQARAFADLGRWKRSKDLLARAETIAERISDTKILACVHKIKGKYYMQKGDFARAGKSFLTSCRLLAAAGDKESLAKLYLQLARLHFV